MAAIHTESAAIFGSKNVNVSEEKITIVDYKPVNPITPNTVVEFVIPGHGDQYISLKDTRLFCEVEFTLSEHSGRDFMPVKPVTPEHYTGRVTLQNIPGMRDVAPPPPPNKKARDIPSGAGPRASDATARHEVPIDLNAIADLDERRRVTEEYEARAHEWNNYVATIISGSYAYRKHTFPIDAIFHTMWNGVDVFMNHQLVSTTNTMYAYKSYIETLLNNTASTKTYQLRNIGFTGPEAQHKVSHMVDSDAAPYAESDAQERRKRRYRKDVTYTLMGYLSSDMWNIQASVLNGVEIGIKLYPNKDSFRLMAFPPGVEATMTLKDVTLKVCKKRMASKVVIGHAEVLKRHDATYPFTRSEVRSFTLNAGRMSGTIENPYQSNIPTRLVVGFVRADAKAGSFSRDPLKFHHYDLATAGFYINDEPVPRRPYELDPASGRFNEPLMELQTAMGKHGEDLGISYEEYSNGAFLIPFEVQPTAAANLQYLARRTGGHCRLELTFKKPLPHNVCVITYALFPSVLEIDQARNVRVIDLEKPFRVASMKGSVNKNQAAITTAPAA